LASEGVVDAFGHITVRHPHDPKRYLMAWARAPELIEADDIMEFSLDGTPTRPGKGSPYLERFIHSGIFEIRADVQSVVHNHSQTVIPFSITGEKLRPVMHNCASIGNNVPVWDSRKSFGDTNMLVANLDMGRDLAASVAGNTTALMRGHGAVVAGKSIREAVFTSVYLQVNADLQFKAKMLGAIEFLSTGEVDKIN